MIAIIAVMISLRARPPRWQGEYQTIQSLGKPGLKDRVARLLSRPVALDRAQRAVSAKTEVVGEPQRARSRERKGKKSRTACANFAHAEPQLTDYTPQSSPSIMGATDNLCAGCIGVTRRHQGRRKGRYIGEALIKCDDARHGGPYCGFERQRPSAPLAKPVWRSSRHRQTPLHSAGCIPRNAPIRSLGFTKQRASRSCAPAHETGLLTLAGQAVIDAKK